jgi:GNAT superfamily N-acetyltransferase
MSETTTSAIRAMDHAQLAAADATITEWLVGTTGSSLQTTYPQIFRAGAAEAFGVYSGEILKSHAAVRRVELIGSRGPLRASFVGAVATDPSARGEQCASRMMHFIADREIEAGQDLILLWSDLWGFYAKLGYVVGGVQAQVEINVSGFGPTACRRAELGDLDDLTNLHADKPWRVERSRAEMELLICGTATDCFVMERGRRIVAYACHRKGLDFDRWWHEFGGTDLDVVSLLPAAMGMLRQERATILVPPYRNELLNRLASRATRIEEGIVALRKPLTAAGQCEFFVDGLDSV